MKCIHCNSEVADGMQFCPYCGSPMAPQQQPQQGQYQQPQQGQYQQPQQGQYQQPQQGQYQQPQQGQYQQPQQGQYQQPQQGQYQQPQQGQYQQPQYQSYYQPKPQQPHRPQLTFMEAINLASHRLNEIDGRSRRSEYWWWFLAVSLGSIVVGLIPYLGNFIYIVQYILLYAVTIRRLNDCSAPTWLRNIFQGGFALTSFCMMMLGFALDGAEGAISFIEWFGEYGFMGMLIGGSILSIIVFVYSIKDSNPDIDPMYGPSPKYTL